jgi:hypothetical protein
MEIGEEELAKALIRAGFYFPSQHREALVAARDILEIVILEREEACGPPI